MPAVPLLFVEGPVSGPPVDLLFGALPGGFTDATATIALTLPAPTLTAWVAEHWTATVSGVVLPGPTVASTVYYASRTDRPTVAATHGHWGDADARETGVSTGHRLAVALRNGAAAGHGPALGVRSSLAGGWGDADRVRQQRTGTYREAQRLQAGQRQAPWRAMLHDRRPSLAVPWGPADARRVSRSTDWQERYRDRRPAIRAPWGPADSLRRGTTGSTGTALPVRRPLGVEWREAIRPPAGMWIPPVLPPGGGCYTPDADLLFRAVWPGAGTALLFACSGEGGGGDPPVATVVVPVRRVYMVFNDVSLTRVVGGIVLPNPTLRMSIDADSWTWTFSATLDGSALADVAPISGEPVEVEAEVNGNTFRFIVERISRERTFASNRISISGRGRNAVLAFPYSPAVQFANSIDRTAAQLANDAMTLSGVPIGWSVTWAPDDWLVPAGVWSHQGSHMSALLSVAQSIGGYVRPHRVGDSMTVLARYPVAPWDWATDVTPDIEIPSAIAVREALQWEDMPAYNRVYVSGARSGILAQVTIDGTAGDVIAPMVTEALITAAAAGRQRGLAVLGNTGRIAAVSLRLPVTSETGVIEPGTFVRYLDGVTPYLGIVRSTAIEADVRTVRQVIGIETHVT